MEKERKKEKGRKQQKKKRKKKKKEEEKKKEFLKLNTWKYVKEFFVSNKINFLKYTNNF